MTFHTRVGFIVIETMSDSEESQQVMSPVLPHTTVHVAMIHAPDRGGQEGFLRALGAGERGRTASAGQGTRDLILRGRGTREPGVVPAVMLGAQSTVHNLADRDEAVCRSRP